MDTLLVTGGAGYIGSHTVLLLLQAGYKVIVLDNLSSGSIEALERVAGIAGREAIIKVGDVGNKSLLKSIFLDHDISSVIHFAGLKSPGESVVDPILYYENNVCRTTALLQAMNDASVKKIVFSSSASVYGDQASMPVKESAPVQPLSPYARTKLQVECMLRDIHKSDPNWKVSILRYFNPVGAHDSGLIGEDPHGLPNNLIPYITQVALGLRPILKVYGADYETKDGTGIRDYIHVMDLAEGHLAALSALDHHSAITVNIGTGAGSTVLEVIDVFSQVIGRPIPYELVARREGDIAISYADPSVAKELLGWSAKRNIYDMCADQWRWQCRNPNGYRGT